MINYDGIDVVDFAYQIIAMHKENERLQQEVEHYKKLNEIHNSTLNKIDNHNKEMCGLILTNLLKVD